MVSPFILACGLVSTSLAQFQHAVEKHGTWCGAGRGRIGGPLRRGAGMVRDMPENGEMGGGANSEWVQIVEK